MREPVSLSLKRPLIRGILSVPAEGRPSNFMTYLAGEWYAGAEWRDVRSPIDLGVLARIPRIPKAKVEEVLEVTHKKGKWMVRDVAGEKRLEIYNRAAAILDENREDFAEVLVKNAGKTVPAANGEVNASIERLRRSDLDTRRISGDLIPGDWSLETLETEAVVRREPLGVVLGVVPFNYPLFDTVNKIVYSTIAGNAILLKPASSTPLPVMMMAKVMEAAGFPKEALSVLTVAGSEMKDIVSDKRIDCITLTGSSGTGVEVLKTAGIKQFVMELGGGDPAVVLNDAELELTVQRITSGITSYAGQRCDAIKVILAEEGAYEGLKRGLVESIGKIVVGDPRDKTTTMGPLIDETTAIEVETSVRDAVAKGGKVLVGGHRMRRNYIEPTLIEMQKDRLGEADLYNSEVFAAVTLITKVSSIDEAISLANGRRYGLDASVFGNDVNKIRKLTRLLEVGAIYINDAPRHGIGYYPFGGRKESGIGFEGIGYTLDYVMGHKSVVYNYKGKGVWEYM